MQSRLEERVTFKISDERFVTFLIVLFDHKIKIPYRLMIVNDKNQIDSFLSITVQNEFSGIIKMIEYENDIGSDNLKNENTEFGINWVK